MRTSTPHRVQSSGYRLTPYPKTPDAAVAAARRAFDSTSWSSDRDFRLHCLRQLKAQLTKHSDELRQVLVSEVGSPLALTYGPQLDIPVNSLDWVIELADQYPWRQELGIVERVRE